LTSIANTAHQSRVLEQALSPLTDRLLALFRHDPAVSIGWMSSRVTAAIVGAIVPLALYLAFTVPGLLATANACIGRLPV
jgi:hypothetical protein